MGTFVPCYLYGKNAEHVKTDSCWTVGDGAWHRDARAQCDATWRPNRGHALCTASYQLADAWLGRGG
eukprot:366499-Chlamydomonas_euryale.AAC.9